jgi:signal peptidase II
LLNVAASPANAATTPAHAATSVTCQDRYHGASGAGSGVDLSHLNDPKTVSIIQSLQRAQTLRSEGRVTEAEHLEQTAALSCASTLLSDGQPSSAAQEICAHLQKAEALAASNPDAMAGEVNTAMAGEVNTAMNLACQYLEQHAATPAVLTASVSETGSPSGSADELAIILAAAMLMSPILYTALRKGSRNAMTPEVLRRFGAALSVMAGTIGLDVVTKEMADKFLLLGQHVTKLHGTVNLQLVRNTGVMYGMGSHLPEWLHSLVVSGNAAVALTALIATAKKGDQPRSKTIALALMAAGGISNLGNYLASGGVRDFLLLQAGPFHTEYFNCADAALTTGLLLLAYTQFRHLTKTTEEPNPKGSSETKQGVHEDPAPPSTLEGNDATA